MKYPFLVLTICLLSACSSSSIIKAALPDRQAFAFKSSEDDTVFRYLCEPGPSQDETAKRARAAHRFYDTNLNRVVKAAIEDLQKSDGGISDTIKINRKIDAGAEKIIEAAEERYMCIVYEIKD